MKISTKIFDGCVVFTIFKITINKEFKMNTLTRFLILTLFMWVIGCETTEVNYSDPSSSSNEELSSSTEELYSSSDEVLSSSSTTVTVGDSCYSRVMERNFPCNVIGSYMNYGLIQLHNPEQPKIIQIATDTGVVGEVIAFGLYSGEWERQYWIPYTNPHPFIVNDVCPNIGATVDDENREFLGELISNNLHYFITSGNRLDKLVNRESTYRNIQPECAHMMNYVIVEGNERGWNLDVITILY